MFDSIKYILVYRLINQFVLDFFLLKPTAVDVSNATMGGASDDHSPGIDLHVRLLKFLQRTLLPDEAKNVVKSVDRDSVRRETKLTSRSFH